jgi:two-component system, sensor histidine kinase and response regulator
VLRMSNVLLTMAIIGGPLITAGVVFALLRRQARVNTRHLTQTNEALAKSEETLRLAVEAAAEGVFDWYPKTGEVIWTPRSYTMLGFEPGEFEVTFDSWTALVHPDDRESVFAHELHRIDTGDRSFRAEYRLRTKAGDWLWAVSRGRAVSIDGEGNVERVTGTNADVTEHRKAQEAVRRYSQLLESLVAVMRKPFSTTQEFLDNALDEALRLTGSAFGYIFRYDESTGSFIPESWSRDVMPEGAIADPETRSELGMAGIWKEVVRKRAPIISNDFPAEHPLEQGYPEGHTALERYLVVPVLSDDRVVAVVGVANKVTEYDSDHDVVQLSLLMDGVFKDLARVESEVLLRQLEVIVSRGPAIAFTWSAEAGRPVKFASRNISQFGYDAEDLRLTRKRYTDLIHPDDAQRVTDAVQGRDRDGTRQVNLEYRILTGTGEERWVSESSWIVLAEDGTPSSAQGVVIDITDTRLAKIELEQHRSHLEELVEARTRELDEANAKLVLAFDNLTRVNEELGEANAAKSRFLANMSHELRTPLNSIIGFSSMLSNGTVGPLTDEQALQIGMVHKSGKQLLELVNDILDLSKVEAAAIEVHVGPLDPVEIVTDVAEAVRPLAAEKGIGLRVDVPKLAMVIETDKDKLRQILMNIVGNAVKFTVSGEVSVRLEHGDDSRVVFIVSDTGPGIATGDIERVFDAFQQVEQAGAVQPKGTGLGLAISREFARLLGGGITATSKEGKGSVFTLWLPG